MGDGCTEHYTEPDEFYQVPIVKGCDPARGEQGDVTIISLCTRMLEIYSIGGLKVLNEEDTEILGKMAEIISKRYGVSFKAQRDAALARAEKAEVEFSKLHDKYVFIIANRNNLYMEVRGLRKERAALQNQVEHHAQVLAKITGALIAAGVYSNDHDEAGDIATLARQRDNYRDLLNDAV